MELSNGGHRTYDREVGIQGNYMQFGHIQIPHRWFHGPDLKYYMCKWEVQLEAQLNNAFYVELFYC